MKKNFVVVFFLSALVLPEQSHAFAELFDYLFKEDEKKARLHYGEGNFGEGLNIYSKLTAKEEETALLLNNLATGQSMLGEKNAEENFKKAIELMLSNQNPSQAEKKQLADIYFNLGQHYFSRSLYKKAIESYIENLKLSPDDITARHNLELALLKQKEKNNSQQKDSEVSPQSPTKNQETKDSSEQESKSPPPLDKETAASLKFGKNENPNQQQEQNSKITQKRAREILESLEQTWNDRDHVKTYQEIFNPEETGKKW